MNEETIYRGPELEEPDRGNLARGILGALLGALIGAVPWLLASVFAHRFVGWLGFLVGFAASYGYQKLGGRKTHGLAMIMVLAASAMALVAADLAGNLLELCMDPAWQSAARREGVSLVGMAFEFIMMPKNRGLYLPNLILGLVIGLLGAFAAGGTLRRYTDPRQAAGTMEWQQAAPVSTGLPLPYSFTVQTTGASRKGGKVLLLLAAGFFLVFGILTAVTGEVLTLAVGFMLSLVLAAEGTLFLRLGKNYRLEVEGEQLRFTARSGRTRTFAAGDIGSVAVPRQLSRVLYDREGQVLAKLDHNMKNMPLLTQYLAEHNVPLRG